MNIDWLGHSSYRLKGKNAILVTDPFDPDSTGLNFPKVKADIVTISHKHKDHNAPENVLGDPKILDTPGEYEIRGVTIFGIPTFHDDKNGQERGQNTVFSIHMDNINLCHLGDLGHELSEEQLEQVGTVDILFVPVGGVYTIDAVLASELVANIDPKIVIPMHYKVPQLSYNLSGVEQFVKELGIEPNYAKTYTVTLDTLPDDRELVILEPKSRI